MPSITLKYPALFLYERDTHGPAIFFPDIMGCVTCAESDVEGIEMAKEALSLYLHKSHLKAIPKPKPHEETIRVSVVGVDVATLEEPDGLAYYAISIIYPCGITTYIPDFPEFEVNVSDDTNLLDLSHLKKSLSDYFNELSDIDLPRPRKLGEVMKIIDINAHFFLKSNGIIYSNNVIEFKPDVDGMFINDNDENNNG